MKIVVITGSAHGAGASSYLADKFIEGAEVAGHTIFRFDAAHKDVHPCIGCYKCISERRCTFQDDMNELTPHLIESDAVAFIWSIRY